MRSAPSGQPDLQNNGTYLFAIDDLQSARVRRGPAGRPVFLMRILPMDLNSGNHGGGQVGYHKVNESGGILFPQVNLRDIPEWAQIYETELQVE